MIERNPGLLATLNFPVLLLGLLLAMNLLIPYPSFAQQVRFEVFTTNNGLAGNNTSTVAQDDLGFLWFINDGKMHRFDGRNFLTYPPPDELKDEQGSFLGLASYQDSLLFLWSEKLAFLFNPKTGGWQKINIKEGDAQNDKIQFWQKFGQENILLTTLKIGFKESIILHLKNDQLEPILFPDHIRTLETPDYWCDIDTSGMVYLAFLDTLYQLDPSGQEISVTPLNSICTDCYNLCFKFGPDGTLVLLADWNFYILDRRNNRFIPHPANRFLQSRQIHLHRFILEDNGDIWACGMDRNLVYYGAAEDTLLNFHDELVEFLPNPNDFKGLFRDNTGMIWVDTRMGLLKVRHQVMPFDRHFSGLNQNAASFSFRGFTEDSLGMIYGVFYDGIAKFDPDHKKDQQVLMLGNDPYLFDLYADGNIIWVNGGQFLDPASGLLKDVPSPFLENPVRDNGFFERDMEGTLWWASHYSLLFLNKAETGDSWVKEIEMPERVVNKTEALHAGRHSGTLWISFKGKLLQYDPKTKSQHWFALQDSGLPVSRVMAIEEDREGKLWLGTDIGLIYFDPINGAARQFTVNEGLANNFVCGLLTEGDSCLWLSTNHGLSRFNIPSATFVNFFEDNGLSDNEFNRKSYFKARNGRMFFGGIQGVNSFFPDKVMQVYQRKNQDSKLVLSTIEYIDEKQDAIIRKHSLGILLKSISHIMTGLIHSNLL